MQNSHIIREAFRNFLLLAISGVMALFAIDNIPWSSLSYFEEEDDNHLLNLYQNVLCNQPVRPLIDDVAIIAIDDCTREETGQLLKILGNSAPACIGLDIVYFELSDADTILKEGLHSVKQKLFWTYIDENVPSNEFYLSEYMQDAEPVDVRLNVSGSNRVSDIPRWDTESGIPPMGLAMARRMSSSSYARYEEMIRENRQTPIMFSLGDVEIIEAQEILDYPAMIENFNNRALLLGIAHSADDTHNTLLGNSTPGVLIQAMTAATILYQSYPRSMPKWLAWLIGGLFAILTLWVTIICDGKDYSNLIGRILPCLVLVLTVIIGYKIFSKLDYVIDIEPIILWPGALMLVFDTYKGLWGIGAITKRFLTLRAKSRGEKTQN